MADAGAPDTMRRAVLGLCLLDDVDVEIADDHVTVDGRLELGWPEITAAIGTHDPESRAGIDALRDWVAARRAIDALSDAQRLARARAVALPVDHLLHPGADWVEERVLGGALEVGLAMRGVVRRDPEEVGVLPPALLAAAGISREACWERAVGYREEMAAYAVDRLVRDPLSTLRPVGECDVLTLLSSPRFRAYLVSMDDLGMRTAAVPTRTHGWLDLARIDPAFASTVAASTTAEQRGLERPVLLTRDEVVQVRPGGAHDLGDLVRRRPPK